MLPFPIMNTYGNIVLTPTFLINTMKATSGQAVYILYNNGELYSRGNGAGYILGNGSTTSITSSWYQSITNVKMFSVSPSANTGIIVLKNDNTLWHCGNLRTFSGNSSGTASNTTWTNVTSYFGTIDITQIKDIKMTNYSICVLLNSGDVYVIGSMPNSEYGNGITSYSSLTLILSGVSKIYTTGDAFAYIDTSNALYRSGLNTQGRLGNGTANGTVISTSVKFTQSTGQVVDFLFGLSNTYILVSENSVIRLYNAGLGTSGQLGNGSTTTQLTYTLISSVDGLFSKFVNNSLSSGISCLITSTTGLYVSGTNTNYSSGMTPIATTTVYNTFTKGVYGFDTYNNIRTILNVVNVYTFIIVDDKIYYTGSANTNIGLGEHTSFWQVTGLPY